MINKCRYFNDHQSAACLMVDDLVPALVSRDGKTSARDDWGYLRNSDESLYAYLSKWLFDKYPEIRGTVFLPLDSHNYIDQNSGYCVKTREMDQEFFSFLHNISDRFEFAFHGVKHAWFDNISYMPVHEFARPTEKIIEHALERVHAFTDHSGIRFMGGKFPGYKYDSKALEVIPKLGCKWWALDSSMIQRVGQNSVHYHESSQFINIPTNLCGDIYNTNKSKDILRSIKSKLKNRFSGRPNDFLSYLYEQSLPITIQEHYQNQRTDGIRQRPNLFDDIASLDILFGYLRSKDIWHANCTEIAHYFDSYQRVKIAEIGQNSFSISYSGLFESPMISIVCDSPIIDSMDGSGSIKGLYKSGKWIFNINNCGEYRVRK